MTRQPLLLVGLFMALGPATGPVVPLPGRSGVIAVAAAKKKCTNNPRHRWDVKTLADSEASRVDTSAVPTTIQALRALSTPRHWRRGRHAPTETRTFVLSARLLRWHRSGDRDFHLVLADPRDTTQTVVGEVPDPLCVGEAAASWRPVFSRLRDLVKGLSDGTPVTVVGVGFFDQDRGQDGGVPNGIELHPVIEIRPAP